MRSLLLDGLIVSALIAGTAQPATSDQLIGTYNVYYRANAAGCSPSAPNPFDWSYFSGPILVDPALTPPGDYRIEILGQLDPANAVGGFRVWSGNATTGTQFNPYGGSVFHHASGQIYLYFHDWYPWDNPPAVGHRVALYRTNNNPDLTITKIEPVQVVFNTDITGDG